MYLVSVCLVIKPGDQGAGFRLPIRGRGLSRLQSLPTEHGAYLAYPAKVSLSLFPVSKVAGACEVDHAFPSGAKVKNTWCYTFLHPYTFMA